MVCAPRAGEAAATGPAARQRAARIHTAVRESGAELVRLRIYAVPARVTSAVVVAVRPSQFIAEQIQTVFASMRSP